MSEPGTETNPDETAPQNTPPVETDTSQKTPAAGSLLNFGSVGDLSSKPAYIPDEWYDADKKALKDIEPAELLKQLEKSHNQHLHFRKLVSQGEQKVPAEPAEYKIPDEVMSDLEAEDREELNNSKQILALKAVMHEAGVNQHTFEKIMRGMSDNADLGNDIATPEGNEPTPEEIEQVQTAEFEKLGSDRDKIISGVASLRERLIKERILDKPEQFDDLNTFTAEGVKTLYKIARYLGEIRGDSIADFQVEPHSGNSDIDQKMAAIRQDPDFKSNGPKGIVLRKQHDALMDEKHKK